MRRPPRCPRAHARQAPARSQGNRVPAIAASARWSGRACSRRSGRRPRAAWPQDPAAPGRPRSRTCPGGRRSAARSAHQSAWRRTATRQAPRPPHRTERSHGFLSRRHGSHHVWSLAFAHFVTVTWVPPVRLPFGSVRHLPSDAFRSSSRPATDHRWIFCGAQLRRTTTGEGADADEIVAQTEPDLSLPPLTSHCWTFPPAPQFATTTLAPTADFACRHSPSSALVTVPECRFVTAVWDGSIQVVYLFRS